MKMKKSERGFAYANFKDAFGADCTIQKSSIATDDCIILGHDKLNLREYTKENGWVPRPEFDESTEDHHFLANNMMTLTREQVAKLLPVLQRFVETGEIYK
jgi:hypothetical protein